MTVCRSRPPPYSAAVSNNVKGRSEFLEPASHLHFFPVGTTGLNLRSLDPQSSARGPRISMTVRFALEIRAWTRPDDLGRRPMAVAIVVRAQLGGASRLS